MIKITTITPALLLSVTVNSQITITLVDIPDAGDVIRVSLTNSIGANNAFATGPNHTWNYNTLVATAQRQEISSRNLF